MKYFITAIGTDSGKTLFSAILTEHLKADYWKPVQAGYPRDTDQVQTWITNSTSVFHPERYLLKTPASPHAAAKIDGVAIKLSDFTLPDTTHPLVVEGAGGVLVPINDTDYVIDLAKHLKLPVILVANLYLGSINHTLLTIEYLKAKGFAVAGLVFNGPSNPESERIIEMKSGWPVILRIEQEQHINKETIRKYAAKVKLP